MLGQIILNRYCAKRSCILILPYIFLCLLVYPSPNKEIAYLMLPLNEDPHDER